MWAVQLSYDPLYATLSKPLLELNLYKLDLTRKGGC